MSKKITKVLFLVVILVVCGYTVIASVGDVSLPCKKQSSADTRTIDFAGYKWDIKSGYGGPGPNYWSDSEDNVWVDSEGRLHLKITNRSGSWYCSEVCTQHFTQYGKHRFYVIHRLDELDKNVVLGLFLYKDDETEIDIEFARWGVENPGYNAQYVVQPWYKKGNMERFLMQLGGTYTTHYLDWQSSEIEFKSIHGHSEEPPDDNYLIHEWAYTGDDIPAEEEDLRAHINIWLQGGNPPSDGQEVEIIIKDADLPPSQSPSTIFDTGPGTYPSIKGTHNGSIKLRHDVCASKMYTYPCSGTGGHSKYVRIYNESGTLAEGYWEGYQGDYHNITFPQQFTLIAGKTYNYTIKTGSYPQIIHEHVFTTMSDAEITCFNFTDANGNSYDNWIPAIILIEQLRSDFSISVNPTRGKVQQGGCITQTDVTVMGIQGYDHNVSLSAYGQPIGVEVTFFPPIAKSPYTSNVTIKVDPSVPAGDYTMIIKGTGTYGKGHSCNYILTVDPPGTTITIEEVMPNEKITGSVSGVADPSQYKVVVYVKTDIWYIHPYLNSFAAISSDGSWEIGTVQRYPAPTILCAFLVEKDYKAPDSVMSNWDITYLAKDCRDL
jgi:hypothetical protein